MKIAYTGLDLPQGKIKFNDEIFVGLVKKFQPKKVSPYYFEFFPDNYVLADLIMINNECLLDLLILDIEKIEGRLTRTKDPFEKEVLKKSLVQLDDQKPICDLRWDDTEQAVIKALGLLSLTPTLGYKETSADITLICRNGMKRASMMFFYTVGKQEIRAWLVEKETDAATCAGKIHSDLARGFIKAEIVSYEDIMKVYSMQDARSKELTKLVDHNYVIPANSILEIRFNV